VDGAGLVLWVGSHSDASFGFLPKRSIIPKQDKHRNDIIQRALLGTDML